MIRGRREYADGVNRGNGGVFLVLGDWGDGDLKKKRLTRCFFTVYVVCYRANYVLSVREVVGGEACSLIGRTDGAAQLNRDGTIYLVVRGRSIFIGWVVSCRERL